MASIAPVQGSPTMASTSLATTSTTLSVAPISNPTAAQQSFMQAMTETSAVSPVTSISSSQTGRGNSINYTAEYLQAFAKSMTSQKVPSTPVSGDTTYPAARHLLASWFSLLTPEEQAVATQRLQEIAPGLSPSVLASQGQPHPGSPAGSAPTQDALAQSAQIPTGSVATALNDVIAAMDPSLYNVAGQLAMNYQMATNVIVDGMPLLSYVNQAAVETLQENPN